MGYAIVSLLVTGAALYGILRLAAFVFDAFGLIKKIGRG